jgi:integral membrane protein (TIGR01906 family)
MKQSKALSVFLSVAVACLVLSASIAAPILCRPFYYAHIGPLRLEASTGLEEAQIRQAYDEMLDFCIGLRKDFSTGVLPWSESGRSHFVDVRALFLLDLAVLAVSALLLLGDLLLRSRRKVQPYRFLGRGPGFWGAAGLGTVFAVVGLLASLDFDRAFVIFHALFFPGKDNWLFDWRTDAIILILPEEFFRNCAILIVALLLVWCAVLIVTDLWLGNKLRPNGQCTKR